VRIVRPKVRDRRKQESKSEVFTGKGESMTLSSLAKVRFVRGFYALHRGLDGRDHVATIDRWHALAVNKSDVITR
jgi:hypothetical protein